MDEWISVDDRLPERGISVLIYSLSGVCNKDKLITGCGEPDYFMQAKALKYKVTHWQPLPQPPKE